MYDYDYDYKSNLIEGKIGPMSKSKSTLQFSAAHSRNSFDWKYEEIDGRHTFVANGGVRKRAGLLVTALGRYGAMTKGSMTAYLQENFHASFNSNDLSAPLRQLESAGVVECEGKKWTLTPTGKKLWANIEKVWKLVR